LHEYWWILSRAIYHIARACECNMTNAFIWTKYVINSNKYFPINFNGKESCNISLFLHAICMRPILARANMGLDFVSGQYGCLFSRCRKYVINDLIHGHFHIDHIIPRPSSKIENSPYNLMFTTQFNDSSILITIISWDYLNLSKVCNKWFNTWAFPYWPYHPSTHIGTRLRLGPIWGSRNDNQANMEMPMYQSVNNKL
jgi:hypothetical protein